MSKSFQSCQEIVKDFSKKLSKSCQKVFKKLSTFLLHLVIIQKPGAIVEKRCNCAIVEKCNGAIVKNWIERRTRTESSVTSCNGAKKRQRHDWLFKKNL
jgi:hypothetical protein